jgi:hypothetical protein
VARENPYEWIEVETFIAPPGPYSSKIRMRPTEGGKYPPDTVVECSRDIRKSHPVGTRFRIQCKVTDKEGGKPFLYSNYKWPHEVISTPKKKS